MENSEISNIETERLIREFNKTTEQLENMKNEARAKLYAMGASPIICKKCGKQEVPLGENRAEASLCEEHFEELVFALFVEGCKSQGMHTENKDK